MSTPSGHFDEMSCLLYLEGQLDEDHAREAAAHVASCGACRELLRALEKEAAWLHTALVAEDEAVPARLAEAPGRSSMHWGWITALGLSAGGVYTLWTSFVEPWAAQAQNAGFTQGNFLTLLFFSGAFWKGWDAMRSLMEFLAMATLGAVVIWMLRKQWRHFTSIAVVMGALACALALPPAATAADVRHGDPSFTLPAGEEVKTDLIVAADRTRIDGDVDGDLIVFSHSVVVNGHVKGDVIAFAQELRVNGPVDGNVRAFDQSLTINTAINKNLMAFAQEMTLNDKASVGGTMTLFTQVGDVEGHLGGDLLAFAQVLEIDGTLDRDASIRGERLKIGPTAEIKGQAKFEGRRQPEISVGAKLSSPIDVTIRRPGPDYTRFLYYWHQVLAWGASFLFGLVLLLIAPAFFIDVVNSSRRAGPAIGLGVLFLFATPIAAIIACITIVGLGLGLSAILLYLVALYSTQVFVGAWIGEKLLGSGIGIGPALGRLALGLAVIRVLVMIPFLGPLVVLAVIVWGLGALALTTYKRTRPTLAATA